LARRRGRVSPAAWREPSRFGLPQGSLVQKMRGTNDHPCAVTIGAESEDKGRAAFSHDCSNPRNLRCLSSSRVCGPSVRMRAPKRFGAPGTVGRRYLLLKDAARYTSNHLCHAAAIQNSWISRNYANQKNPAGCALRRAAAAKIAAARSSGAVNVLDPRCQVDIVLRQAAGAVGA
jgi:hypothetical protein